MKKNNEFPELDDSFYFSILNIKTFEEEEENTKMKVKTHYYTDFGKDNGQEFYYRSYSNNFSLVEIFIQPSLFPLKTEDQKEKVIMQNPNIIVRKGVSTPFFSFTFINEKKSKVETKTYYFKDVPDFLEFFKGRMFLQDIEIYKQVYEFVYFNTKTDLLMEEMGMKCLSEQEVMIIYPVVKNYLLNR